MPFSAVIFFAVLSLPVRNVQSMSHLSNLVSDHRWCSVVVKVDASSTAERCSRRSFITA